jgi:hypothetical protein
MLVFSGPMCFECLDEAEAESEAGGEADEETVRKCNRSNRAVVILKLTSVAKRTTSCLNSRVYYRRLLVCIVLPSLSPVVAN